MRFRVDPRQILRDPVHFLAFGFGAGMSPWAPGTMGTLVAVPLVWYLTYLPVTIMLCLTAAAAVLGVVVCGQSATRLGVHDHPGIVWDEIVGYAVTMVAVPHRPSYFLAGFILFRFFDIAKPWPIREADHRLSGGVGIMLDDVMAGVVSCALLHIAARYALP